MYFNKNFLEKNNLSSRFQCYFNSSVSNAGIKVTMFKNAGILSATYPSDV